MPSMLSEDQLCESVLDFVTNGTYPDSEDVVASEFPASALPEALLRISKAREQAEVRAQLPLVRQSSLTSCM